MKKSLVMIFVLAFCLPIARGTVYAAEYIRIGSFNIANFGSSQQSEYERSLVSLVNIILVMKADVIALQEVEPGEMGADQVMRLTKLLNKASNYYNTPIYEYIIAETYTGDETTAFLWRDPISLESDIQIMEHERDPDSDGVPTFQREPHYALFTANNYDFYLVNCHLYTKLNGTSSEGRGDEFDAIVSWLKALEGENERDAVVIGDFNRFLNGKNEWKRLMIQDHVQWFRFPLLEAIKGEQSQFNPSKDEAPEDKFSTTTSKKKSIYDQILISKGSYYEFVNDPNYDTDVAIVAFDMEDQYKWATQSWYDAIKTLSDHRPIWIRLRIDRNDDDP